MQRARNRPWGGRALPDRWGWHQSPYRQHTQAQGWEVGLGHWKHIDWFQRTFFQENLQSFDPIEHSRIDVVRTNCGDFNILFESLHFGSQAFIWKPTLWRGFECSTKKLTESDGTKLACTIVHKPCGTGFACHWGERNDVTTVSFEHLGQKCFRRLKFH